MKRLYLSFFLVVFLLTQWGSLGHDYHIHDPGESCDYCLSAHALDHAVMPAIENLFGHSFLHFHTESVFVSAINTGFQHYSARAPPRFI
ncbi:MAG: hypothetical protein OQK46_06785 [Gammaproteobacteria bacterium]|nr:hypothetical protein [Gammaproteobacteria bacterium]